MTTFSRLLAALTLLSVPAGAVAETIVLRGGLRYELKGPPVRKGNTLLVTRTDGTVLAVPVSEVDAQATAAARSAAPSPAPAPPAPAVTLMEAARASREVPKARVRITDADVSHTEAAEAAQPKAGGAEAPKPNEAAAGVGRVEVAEYTQQKSGDSLVVRGTLRNPGATPAINIRMTVTALDPKGQVIGSAEAGVSNGVIEPSGTAMFTVTIAIGARSVGSFRFSPRWVSPALPGGSDGAAVREQAPAAAAPAAPPRANPPPPPQ